MSRTIAIVLTLITLAAPRALAISPDAAKKLYDRAAPSLVAVRFTWESELGRRELTGAGVVVGKEGLVMSPVAVFNPQIPDEQMKDFLIIVAHEDRDAEEIEADFNGRDERSGVAFLTARAPKDGATRDWKPIKFEDTDVAIAQPVYSVGMLPEMANYKPYFMEAAVSAKLRGAQPQVLVQGGLAAVGSPVFSEEGKAIGVVNWQPGQTVFLNDGQNALGSVIQPPKFYVPTQDFQLSLDSPPKNGQPLKLPWMGVSQMTGLNKG